MSERIHRFIASSYWAKWRSANANHTIDRIEELDDSEYFDPERYFPLYHLDLAARLFSKGGEFDYASIFHSSCALALGLLIKLNTKLTEDERRRLRLLSLRTLLRTSKDKGLLDEEHYRLAQDIRNIRNCYVHFENMMAYFNQIQRYLKDRQSILRTYPTNEEKEVVEIILNSQSTEAITLPDTTWCANMAAVRFLENRQANFGRGLVKTIAETLKKDLKAKKVKKAYHKFEGLSPTTADASYCLNKTAEILAWVGILPKKRKSIN
jgi:hypothetical protein